jgi:hypothetical protein
MILGEHPPGRVPVASRLDGMPVIPLSLFKQLLLDSKLERVYLFELTVENSVGADVNLKLSTHGWASDTEGSADQVFSGFLSSPLNFGIKLFNSKTLTGRSKFGAGSVTIINCSCVLDDFLTDTSWDKYDFTIKMGGLDFDYDDFGAIFIGRAESVTWDEEKVSIRIRDGQIIFDDLIQENLYSGTGGLNGTDELTGKPKPLCYGVVKNITPINVDPVNQIYHIHDGPIAGVDEVYFNGLAATAGTDYSVGINNGTVTLLVSPNGIVTCDVRGCNNNGYAETGADIIKKIAKDVAGLVDADINLQSFNNVNDINGLSCGFYTGVNAVSMSAVFDQLASSIGGFWGMNRLSKLFVGLVVEPTRSVRTIKEVELLKIARVATPSPTHLTRIAYQKNWTVMSADRVAGAVTDSRKLFLSEEYRFKDDIDGAVKTRHPINTEREVLALLSGAAAASSEAARQQALFGADRDYYNVKVGNPTYQLNVGDVVKLIHTRFGLENGRAFMVVGFSENVKNDTLDLILWG